MYHDILSDISKVLFFTYYSDYTVGCEYMYDHVHGNNSFKMLKRNNDSRIYYFNMGVRQYIWNLTLWLMI